MRLKRYHLLLLIPPVVSLALAYFFSEFLVSLAKDLLLPSTGKGFASLPDFEVKRERMETEVMDYLALLKVEERIPARVQIEKDKEEPPAYSVSFTYVGPKRGYAIINGALVKEGDRLPSGEGVVKITKEGVLLEGRWGRRWVYILK